MAFPCLTTSSGIGRLDFGIGAGWKQDEYEAYGYAFPGIGIRQAQMSEAIDLSRLMWTEATAKFDGKHYQLVDAVSAPKPVQSTIPIWISGHGDNLRAIHRHLGCWYAPLHQSTRSMLHSSSRGSWAQPGGSRGIRPRCR